MRFKDHYGKLFSENIQEDFFYMYHGGTMNRVKAPTKGRWEYGPGLYLTNSYELARKYGMGSRRVFRCKIARGKDLSESLIDTRDVEKFIELHGGSKRADYRSFISRHNKDGMFPAEILVNLAVNNNMRSSSANALREFLRDHGVDYALNRWSGGEAGTYVLTLYDDSNLLEFKPISRVVMDEYLLPVPM